VPSPVAVHPACASVAVSVGESLVTAAVSKRVGVRGCSQEFTLSPPLGMPLPRARALGLLTVVLVFPTNA
jgi:hypothetical protein